MKLIIPALAALMLAAPAFAQEAPKADKPDFQAHSAERRAEFATDRYAHAVGKFATLEVQLKLTAAQKPLFEKWKAVKLAHVKANTDKFAEFKPLGKDASPIDRRKLQITRLETHLAQLKAETPSFEAFVKSLDKDQIEVLKRASHKPHFGQGRFAEFFQQHRGPFGGPMGGPQGGPRGDRPHHGQHAMMDGEGAMGADD